MHMPGKSRWIFWIFLFFNFPCRQVHVGFSESSALFDFRYALWLYFNNVKSESLYHFITFFIILLVLYHIISHHIVLDDYTHTHTHKHTNRARHTNTQTHTQTHTHTHTHTRKHTHTHTQTHTHTLDRGLPLFNDVTVGHNPGCGLPGFWAQVVFVCVWTVYSLGRVCVCVWTVYSLCLWLPVYLSVLLSFWLSLSHTRIHIQWSGGMGPSDRGRHTQLREARSISPYPPLVKRHSTSYFTSTCRVYAAPSSCSTRVLSMCIDHCLCQ
jgi:hypothetical protein